MIGYWAYRFRQRSQEQRDYVRATHHQEPEVEGPPLSPVRENFRQNLREASEWMDRIHAIKVQS